MMQKIIVKACLYFKSAFFIAIVFDKLSSLRAKMNITFILLILNVHFSMAKTQQVFTLISSLIYYSYSKLSFS